MLYVLSYQIEATNSFAAPCLKQIKSWAKQESPFLKRECATRLAVCTLPVFTLLDTLWNAVSTVLKLPIASIKLVIDTTSLKGRISDSFAFSQVGLGFSKIILNLLETVFLPLAALWNPQKVEHYYTVIGAMRPFEAPKPKPLTFTGKVKAMWHKCPKVSRRALLYGTGAVAIAAALFWVYAKNKEIPLPPPSFSPSEEPSLPQAPTSFSTKEKVVGASLALIGTLTTAFLGKKYVLPSCQHFLKARVSPYWKPCIDWVWRREAEIKELKKPLKEYWERGVLTDLWNGFEVPQELETTELIIRICPRAILAAGMICFTPLKPVPIALLLGLGPNRIFNCFNDKIEPKPSPLKKTREEDEKKAVKKTVVAKKTVGSFGLDLPPQSQPEPLLEFPFPQGVQNDELADIPS